MTGSPASLCRSGCAAPFFTLFIRENTIILSLQRMLCRGTRLSATSPAMPGRISPLPDLAFAATNPLFGLANRRRTVGSLPQDGLLSPHFFNALATRIHFNCNVVGGRLYLRGGSNDRLAFRVRDMQVHLAGALFFEQGLP